MTTSSESLKFVIVLCLAIVASLFPFLIAWLHSRRLPRRGLFIGTCGLLSFGFLGAVGAILVPIDVAAIFLVPQWKADGAIVLPKLISTSSDYVTMVAVGTAVLASILVPRKLSRRWPQIVAGLASQEAPPK